MRDPLATPDATWYFLFIIYSYEGFSRVMTAVTTERLLQLLMPEPAGLSAPELRRALRTQVSQPTIWRLLDALRSTGAVIVEGRGRATRYHAAARRDPAALRSLQMHRAAARRLVADPGARDTALRRLERLRAVNPHGRTYHDRWQALLDGPLPSLLRAMTEDSELAETLRKESPFTVLVTPAERRSAFARSRTARQASRKTAE